MRTVASLIVEAKAKGIEATKRSLRSLGSESKKTERATDGLAKSVKNLVGAYVGIGTAVAGFRQFINVNRQFQVLQSTLKVATGSAEAASAKFKELNEFAANTPFQLTEVTEAFIKLKNFGLDPSEAALTSYGNTVSALGKPLEQLVEAVADAVTGEFERLKEFGIKSKKEGDNVSFTFKGVTTTIKNSSQEIQKYLQDIGNTDFAGAVTERMKTLDGAISNLQQNWTNLWANEEAVSGITSSVNELANTMGKPDVQAGFANLTTAIATLANWTVGGGSAAINNLTLLGKNIGSMLGNVDQNDLVLLQDRIATLQNSIGRRESLGLGDWTPGTQKRKEELAELKKQEEFLLRAIRNRMFVEQQTQKRAVDSALEEGMSADLFGSNFKGGKKPLGIVGAGGSSSEKEDLEKTTDLIFEYTTGLEKARMEYERNMQEIKDSEGTLEQKRKAMELLTDAYNEEKQSIYERSDAYKEWADQVQEQADKEAEALQKALDEWNQYKDGVKGVFEEIFTSARSMSDIGDILGKKLLGNIAEKASGEASDIFSGLVGKTGGASGWLGKLGSLFFDEGGYIPSGGVGIVGERGPEIVRGPANVTSRKDTAKQLGNTFNISLPGVTNKKDAFEARGQIERAMVMAMSKAGRYA